MGCSIAWSKTTDQGSSLPNLAGMSMDFHDWGLDASLAEVRHALAPWLRSGTKDGFECRALALFRWQSQNNTVYRSFVDGLGLRPEEVKKIEEIPCLPIESFKRHQIQSGNWDPHHVFRSSGTSSATQRSNHFIDKQGLAWYRDVTRWCWSQIWNTRVEDHDWLALLPGYVGREDASLLHMVHGFMQDSGISDGRMLMKEHALLRQRLEQWSSNPNADPLVLFGVTWAILDWLDDDVVKWEEFPSIRWKEIRIIDTGGMKGRGVEPLKENVHRRILDALPGVQLASEYGMTEMMSQGYALDGVHHRFPHWVQATVKDARDPWFVLEKGRTGRLDVIDLANVHSCAFLATGDAAREVDAGLEILGRVDHAEIRGCSLLTVQ